MDISGKKKLEQLQASSAKVVSTSCLQCRTQLKELVRHYKLPHKVMGVHELVYSAIVLDGEGAGRV
jgi:Fe-S oxidoreductase